MRTLFFSLSLFLYYSFFSNSLLAITIEEQEQLKSLLHGHHIIVDDSSSEEKETEEVELSIRQDLSCENGEELPPSGNPIYCFSNNPIFYFVKDHSFISATPITVIARDECDFSHLIFPPQTNIINRNDFHTYTRNNISLPKSNISEDTLSPLNGSFFKGIPEAIKDMPDYLVPLLAQSLKYSHDAIFYPNTGEAVNWKSLHKSAVMICQTEEEHKELVQNARMGNLSGDFTPLIQLTCKAQAALAGNFFHYPR